jgi:hypothetical protein
MLEAIGSDASLRYASTRELTAALGNADAPEALSLAVATGDSSKLFAELGNRLMRAPQVGQYFSDQEHVRR